MLPYRDSKITTIAILVFFVFIAIYALYEVRGMVFGPQIHVSSTVTEVHEPFIVIKGKADRIATLNLNGKPITVTEDGAFEEPYLLSPGLNHIFLDAVDKYGGKRHQELKIVYTPGNTPVVPATTSASTTPPTATSTPMATSTP